MADAATLRLSFALPQFARSCKRTSLEWLVAFVGLHYPREVMDLILDSFLQNTVEGRVADSSTWFGNRVVEYLAHKSPQGCANALHPHFIRFLSYSPTDRRKEDPHLLAFFIHLALVCPITFRLVLPLVLDHLSAPSIMERLVEREAVIPSQLKGNQNSTFSPFFPFSFHLLEGIPDTLIVSLVGRGHLSQFLTSSLSSSSGIYRASNRGRFNSYFYWRPCVGLRPSIKILFGNSPLCLVSFM